VPTSGRSVGSSCPDGGEPPGRAPRSGRGGKDSGDKPRRSPASRRAGTISAEPCAGVRHGLTCRQTVQPEGPARQHFAVEPVADQGPAAGAGLCRGDEVLRVGERPVSNRFDVERAPWDHRPGDQVEVTVRREGREVSLP
jgi:S1-C subfamily serine protease